MNMKVLATINWHYGYPDGENTIGIVIPDFDIEDRNAQIEAGKQALIDYGVDENTIKLDDFMSISVIFEAEIGEFHRALHPGVKPYTKVCDVTITFRYVHVHRGKVFEPQAIENLYISGLNK